VHDDATVRKVEMVPAKWKESSETSEKTILTLHKLPATLSGSNIT